MMSFSYEAEDHKAAISALDQVVFGDVLPEVEFDVCDGLVMLEGRRLVGYILWDTSTNPAHIRSFAVSPYMQGQGIGSALLKETIGIIGPHITLTLDNHFKDMLEAFYPKFGFKPTEGVTQWGHRVWERSGNLVII